jgi:hypothetical protein
MKQLRAGFCYGFVAILLFSASLASAQDYKSAPPAPIPPDILSDKTAFIANGGGDDSSDFTGGADRAYNEFYAAMKSWGKYKLQPYPTMAGLSLEISFVEAPYDRAVYDGRTNDSQTGDPQLRLLIRDAKSQALLWAFTEHVQWAKTQGNRDKNFDEALGKIVDSFKRLVSPPPAQK